jgi:hypothetical protein
LRENIQGNGDSPRHDLRELVRLLAVHAGFVIELDVVELVLEGMHGVIISFHLFVVAARILHDLINHELRVSPDIEVLDASLDGDSEAAEEGLVLRHVV